MLYSFLRLRRVCFLPPSLVQFAFPHGGGLCQSVTECTLTTAAWPARSGVGTTVSTAAVQLRRQESGPQKMEAVGLEQCPGGKQKDGGNGGVRASGRPGSRWMWPPHGTASRRGRLQHTASLCKAWTLRSSMAPGPGNVVTVGVITERRPESSQYPGRVPSSGLLGPASAAGVL